MQCIRVGLPLQLLVWLVSTTAVGQPDAGTPSPPGEGAGSGPLRVVAAGNPPFVTSGDEVPGGISVEIWKQVALRLERQDRLEWVDTVPEALAMVERGEADVAIGPISITAERAERVAFTQPYHESALAILAPPGGGSLWKHVQPFVSGRFLGGAAVLLLVLLGVGVLLWRVERKHNEMFPEGAVRGAGTGLWLAIVTMTTVGYGDKVTVTPAGRVVASIWMLVSMLTVSSLTAFLATALTVATLDRGAIANAEDLSGRKVAAVAQTTGADFARRHGAKIASVEDVAAAVERVHAGKADAVVYDRPMLRYHLEQSDELDLVLSDATYEPQGYGFAVPRASDLAEQLDVILLDMQERGRIERILTQWLGSE